MWINFLVRTYAWMTLLGKNSVINVILDFLHLPPLDILYTDQAVVLGMVYNFLPFMVLPIYSVLVKLDKNILEAAEDLGTNYFTTLKRIIIPLSLPFRITIASNHKLLPSFGITYSRSGFSHFM
jgi:spermidine/putrescine transport system permease protein